MQAIDTPENSFGPLVWVLTCIQVLPQDFWMTHLMHIVFVVRIWKYWTTSSHRQWNAIIFSFSPYLDVTPNQGYMTLGIKDYWAKTDHWQRRLSANSSNINLKAPIHQRTKWWRLERKLWSFCTGGKETDVLDTMRHQRFQELVTVSKKATPKYVASYIHCSKVSQLRVFHQVQFWNRISSMVKSRAGNLWRQDGRPSVP